MFENFFRKKEKVPVPPKQDINIEGKDGSVEQKYPKLIIASIIQSGEEYRKSGIEDKFADALDVNYYDSSEEMKNKRLKNEGERTYVISPVDERNKKSLGLLNCTSVILVGKDKITGKELSILSHQDPRSFLHSKKHLFLMDLSNSIKELKDRTLDKTIDVIIVGGNSFLRGTFKEDYIKSIRLLSNLLKKETGEEDIFVISGPNTKRGSQSIYFDTNKRRLYLSRSKPISNNTNAAYNANNLDGEIEKWHINSF